MATSFDTTPAGFIDPADDDTIELQLSEAALQALQDAAAAAMADAECMGAANDPEVRPVESAAAVEPAEALPGPASPDPRALPRAPSTRSSLKRGARSPVVFAVLAVAALLLGGVAYLAKSRTRSPAVPIVAARVAAVSAVPAATAARTTATVTATADPIDAPAVAAPPQIDESVPVHVKNPFDRTEVFEFPAGTSDADARDAVAEVLAQRARERQVQLRKVPHRNSRTADRNTPVTITPLTITKVAPQS